MTSTQRRLGIVALTATACLLAAQLSGAASASAGSAAQDAGPAASNAGVSASQTPYLVRTKAARLVGHLKSGQKLRLAIGLKSRDEAGQQKLITALQDKKSPLFHKYLTAAQWNSRFAPTAASEAAVVSFAKSHGLTVTKRYSNRLLVDVEGTARQLEAAFQMTLNEYAWNGKTFFSNASDPALPDSLKSIVSSVDGLDNINRLVPASGMTDTSTMARYSAGPVSQLHTSVHANGSGGALAKAMKHSARSAHPNAAPGIYQPTDIYSSQAYDEVALHKQSNCCNPNHVGTSSPAQSSIAIATAGKHFLTTDMAAWHASFPYLAYSLNEYYIDGTPSAGDYEGTMDTEWATSLANSFGSYQDTAHVYLYSGANAQFATFDDIYNSILTNNTAKVVSSSWGCAEFYCASDGTMNTDHAIFNAMTAQGFTLLNSSGDRGAYADCSHVSVSHPASDTNWLAIGATNLELTAGPVYSSQTAWGDVGHCSGNGGGTGGGCSAKFAAPSYQSVISAFCGSSAKALPDLSLNGDWFNSPQYVYYDGSWSGNGGTSISAPMMAGFYAQQNSYGIELGNICGGGSAACAPLGQGGEQLYHAANIHGAQGKNPMYDITSGCTTNEVGGGYCGIAGYDRATGWGTPNMLQFAWANNYWNMVEASPPSISMSGPSTSGWVNSGSISWTITDNGSPASGVAGYTANWDSDPGNPSSQTTPGTGNSYYYGPASAHGATSGSTGLLDGCHTLYVRAWDNIGESAVNHYGPVCYDHTAPTITTPVVSFLVNKAERRVNGAAFVRVHWTGTDALSGISSYRLWQSTDGGGYVHLTPDGASTFRDLLLRPHHSYQFALGAYDNAGNFAGNLFSTPFMLKMYQENSRLITYSPQWHRVRDSRALGGHTQHTAATGRTATFTFHGNRVMWVTSKGKHQGWADVILDGGAPRVVNTHAGKNQPRRSVYTAGSGNRKHTLVVSCKGTSGHARIDIDAFYVMRPA